MDSAWLQEVLAGGIGLGGRRWAPHGCKRRWWA